MSEITLSKPLPTIKCPKCGKGIKVTELLFNSNFTIIVNGHCCGYEITSGELNILSLVPSKEKKNDN